MKRSFYLGLILFLLLVIVFILNAGFSSVDMSNTLAPFSLDHPLGTDTYGRDLLARLSLGALISLSLSFVITVISTLLGVLLSFLLSSRGLISGFSWVLSDALKSLSSIILALFLSSIFSSGFIILIVSISLAQIPNIARTAYSRLIVVRNEEFVLYARSEGMGEVEIALRHIVPHVMPEVLSQSLSIFSSSILTESSLSFLGAGIPILYPSIGSILSEGRLVMLTHPSLVLIPVSVLFLISLSVHLMHQGSDFDSRFQ